MVDVKRRLARHVSLVCSRKEICDMNLGHVVPIPKSKTTLKSFVSPRDRARETDGDSQFNGSVREPTPEEKKKLIGLMAASAVEVCMANHYYTIGGDIRIQSQG